MPSKHSIGGLDKVRGRHRTVLEEGVQIFKALDRSPGVASIRAGYIQPGGRYGRKSLVICHTERRRLDLVLRCGGTTQELFVTLMPEADPTVIIERIQQVVSRKLRGLELRVKNGATVV
ncbi:MAG: hypothetical protein Greene041619_1160 [Candidatus Peregrinibacteria bacterium Greene0416_19]|nr:MAG: hypothetical protein Greene041619_1160 [Candidatus Peregrinibacteria bacterium Greene0416_19]